MNLILKNIQLIHSKGANPALVELQEILNLPVLPNTLNVLIFLTMVLNLQLDLCLVLLMAFQTNLDIENLKLKLFR